MTSRILSVRPFRECSRVNLRPSMLPCRSVTLIALYLIGLTSGCSRTLDCLPVVDSINDGVVAIEWSAEQLTFHHKESMGSGPLVEGLPVTRAKLNTCLILRKRQIRALHARLVDDGNWKFSEGVQTQLKR